MNDAGGRAGLGQDRGACLDDDTFAAYFDGRLSPGEAQRLFEHVDGCAVCARMFAAIAAAHSLPGPTTGALGSMPTVPASPAATTPAVLGRYRVDRILGMGGMGVVYAAHDPELDRTVAVKLLRPSPRTSAEVLRARLTREAQVMARLSHPNVIPVHEIGTIGDQVFVVMELIDGTTLTEWLRAELRTWREIVQVFVAAGDGLAAAHAQGVVHRDFKPDNVLLSRAGRIYVTDFGVAQLDASDDTPRTAAGATGRLGTYRGLVVGTPGYMAPEQMRGEPADARTDVFSFCAALYEALYETRPYPGTTLDELRAAVDAGRLQPRRRTIGPAAHLRAIERGLSAAPAQRPAAMQDLLTQLRRDPARRRRTIVLVSAFLLLGAALSITAWRSHQQDQVCLGQERHLESVWSPTRKLALYNLLSRSPGSATLADHVTRALDGYATAWVEVRESVCSATRRRGEQSEALLDLRMQCLDDRLDEVRALTDALLVADARGVERAADATHALSSFRECATVTAGAAPMLPADAIPRARLAALRRRFDDAAAQFRVGGEVESLRRLTALAAEPELAAFPALLADVQLERGGALVIFAKDEAVPVLQEAAALGLRSRNDQATANAWMKLALAAGYARHLDDALRWLGIADALVERLGNPVRLRLQELFVRAVVFERNGKLEDADATGRAALALAEKNLSPDDPDLAKPLNVLAVVLTDQGRYAEAAATNEHLLVLLEHSGDGDTLAFAGQVYNLALAYQALERPVDTERSVRRALAIQEARLAPEHLHLVASWALLADALVNQGRLDEAAAIVERVLPLAHQHPNVTEAELLWSKAQIAARRHDVPRAIALYEETLRHPDVSEDRGEVRFGLAQLLWDSGRDRRRALALAAQARGEEVRPASAQAVEAWLAGHHL
jgi:serine/threonine protein kinase/tetratricopeptide (TPR) repeat protein